MPASALNPRPCVLRLGPLPGAAPDELAHVLAKARLPVIALPPDPPASPEAFRQLVRQVGFAVLDLDQNAAALRWLRALRAHRPGLPVIASFCHGDLPELLPTGVAGLDGALQLPAHPDQIAALLKPWLPAAPAITRTDSFFGGPPAPPRASRHSATHLSAASEANQQLLQTLADHPGATRFVAEGPAGAEFTLLALELAARLQISDYDLAFSDRPVDPLPALLVTRDTQLFNQTRAPFSLLVRDSAATCPGPVFPSPPDGALTLELKPLRRRPGDVAHYTARWLPQLSAAAHRTTPCLPLPPAWRHALLDHAWPGEFAELWQTLQRFALLAPDSPLPVGFSAPAACTFEDLIRLSAPRAYRERLGQRIPAELLPSVLGALGCPDRP